MKFKIMCGSAWDGRFFRSFVACVALELACVALELACVALECCESEVSCQIADVSCEFNLAARCQMSAMSCC